MKLPDIPQLSEMHSDGRTVVTPAAAGVFSYHLLVRSKVKGQAGRWVCKVEARSPGDCCPAAAEAYFKEHGYDTSAQGVRFVDGNTWHRIQHAAHLRDIGMKP